MNKQPKLNRVKNIVIVMLVFGSNTIIYKPQAHAFVPYIFEPNPKKLEETSLKIGRTASQLIEIQQNKEAIRLAKLAIRLNPVDARLWSVLAEAQRRNNLLTEARKSLAQAKELSPQQASLWFAEASLALQQKEPKQAEHLLREGLKFDSKNANGYFQLGNAKIMLYQFPKALQAFRKASQLKPTFWEALNNEALILFELEEKQEAILIWRKVLKIQLNAESMLALAAALNHITPKNPESLQLAKKALAKNPNYVLSEHQAEQLWGTKLRKATRELLSHPDLGDATERAKANSDAKVIP